MLPNTALDPIAHAYEVLLATHKPLPDDLWQAICARAPRSGVIDVLIRSVFDADYVLQLRHAGMQVYQARIPDEDLIFLDRRLGFHLPNWEPVANAFSRACRLQWARVGIYMHTRDTVARITDSWLMQVKSSPHLWFNLRNLEALPPIGEQVTILANGSFLDTATPLLDVVAIWQADGKKLKAQSESS